MGSHVGSLYVGVAMARGNPGDCRSGDDVISCGIRRGSLRGGHGLVYASDSGAAGYTIVVGELPGDLTRLIKVVKGRGR